MTRHVLYGHPPPVLSDTRAGTVQVSPLTPGSARLEDVAENALDTVTMLAPPGTIERRYTLALALRALAPGGTLTALAPKDRGGTRLGSELRGFGCSVSEEARRHHRICRVARPRALVGIDEAIAEGSARWSDDLRLFTQPGIFSWNRPDPGSALLLRHLPDLAGAGVDLGCGLGVLASAALRSEAVRALTLVDIDRRAVEMARRNVADSRASVRWADLREEGSTPRSLNFAVMNPPFHDGGAEDRALGQAFIARAAETLRPGGALWLVANTHLPYEASLRAAFRSVALIAVGDGYKVLAARR